MTASILIFDEAKKELAFKEIDLDSSVDSAAQPHLSGKELVKRLAGLLTEEEASELERNIEDSCEQIDD